METTSYKGTNKMIIGVIVFVKSILSMILTINIAIPIKEYANT